MKALYKLILLLLIVATPFAADAQKQKSKAQLEREKKENLNRIKEANRILKQTKAQKEASIGQLNAIKEKITVQKGVITNISREINYIESDVQETEGIVGSLQADLEKLKAEYADMIYAASKSSSNYNKLMFLFASDNFNQLVMRMRYLNQYSEARQKQVEQINKVQAVLTGQLTILEQKKREKKNLLTIQLTETKNLQNLKSQQDSVISRLGKQEQNLQREVAQRQQAVKKLDNLIADIVREEIARAARAARAAGNKTSGSNKVTLTPETALISSSFAGNKGRLAWPVERGFISERFGRHNHPVLKGVVVENRGIDIQTSQGATARAIFEGKVVTVASVPGMNNIVMVQHGEYFTVYAKLKTVSVQTGETVKLKQSIGTVYTDSDGTSELQFQVWKNSETLNPQSWISPK
ncbi:peptidoglycan DD-metalloendopeptidase family protein [Pontibacter sp. BT310]|uniref:Peptidoglycan DD-metalloendopeptidase family protein n=1 Tax=Pontibacter populi TaxID=890055 RepID=A0ABS6XEU0_9BACT|nr:MULTISPECIES: peptidoglycan DD-metalloendopeptidase family protein [Pontibacter]MBJ6119569.1 peptidoglycan DD-metalloendopeptidase family protein [Pontibacter sp. BT310]MBR0571996.1 peptidoglycan DD-metalloendopeptidase family protein [Microvirga sp. STS03]MBW3366422.1 peptidoglycan DD-metalloendopeptidase family protein [Pontibacter populi]